MENKIQQQNNPLTLIEKAIEKGLDVSQLSQLFELKQRYDADMAMKSFRSALCSFQANKPDLIKGKKVSMKLKSGFTKEYNYNPLPTVQKAIDPVLTQYGLSYRWEVSNQEGKNVVTCIISHVDGHSEKTQISAPNDDSGNKSAVQSIASTISYLKRYSLEAALGLASDEDNDGATQPKKELITPDHELFPDMIKNMKLGKVTIQYIEEKYRLSSSAKKQLNDSITDDDLQMLFDLVEDKVPSAEFENIKRIIENKEKANYSRAFYTLTKLKSDDK